MVTELLQNKGLSRVREGDDERKGLREGIEQCRLITRKYGTSFYFATQFFPKDVREAIYAVYAFARIPDEIVDDPNKSDPQLTIAKLEKWRRSWLKAMETGNSDDPVMKAIVFTFSKYGITIEDGEAFLKSMFLDEEKFTYSTYDELDEYMYGSAGVIGLMVTKIIGFHSDSAFPYAIKLGYAFQLTNFLRDIKEDSQDLNRIYMPLNELTKFGFSHEDIRSERFDDKFADFMKFQIARNREVYREALPGIKLLKWRGRLAVRISYVLYKEILAEIERADYNIYKGRVRTNLGQKLWLSAKALVGIYE
ncbi:MAG: phytoene/squalene synthase family protein [Pyrinomonadaceae bacterium]|nr:phytoene/squalene synthase family protein [Pyrinomonadaceae bacterium]